jgi:hypothetical protein
MSGGIGRRLGGVLDQGLDRLGLGARGLLAAGDHHLRGGHVTQRELLGVGALARREGRLGEGVGPAQIVPVVDRIGQGQNALVVGHVGDDLVGLAAGRATLSGEKLDDHRRFRGERGRG